MSPENVPGILEAREIAYDPTWAAAALAAGRPESIVHAQTQRAALVKVWQGSRPEERNIYTLFS